MSLGMMGSADLAIGRGRGSYASPHQTIALRDIPTNIKQVMRLCRFYYHTDALLRAIVEKMAEYPITQLIIEEKDDIDERHRDKWEYLLNVGLDLRNVMKMINIDKYVYGISCHYLHYPFIRYAVSWRGGHRFPIKAIRNLRVTPKDEGKKFILEARGLAPDDDYGRETVFRIEDRKSEARVGINLTRMNPLQLKLEHNPSSGQKDWYWKPTQKFRDGMHEGIRNIIESTEMRILEAAWREQEIHLNPDRLWIAQADQFPGVWDGWGIPPLFPVLEDVYYYKILRRANEALAQEHVTPLRILSPAGTGDVSPQRTMNLADWQSRIRREMMRFRRDPNHVLISPVPMNIEQMGGQARVMMVAAEIEAAARVIAAGLGCPIEMIWGGLNWSGASVSLRVLENHFLNDRENSERLINFLIPKLANYFRLPRVDVKLSEFKMADDVQQQANAINLMMQGYLDRQSVIGEMGYDPDQVFDRLSDEHRRMNKITMEDNVAASHMNTVIQSMEAKAQVLLKYELQLTEESMQARSQRQRLEQLSVYVQKLHAKGVTTPMEFEHSATMLQRMPQPLQATILQNWYHTMPFVTRLLSEKLNLQGQIDAAVQDDMMAAGGPQQFGAAEGGDMQPGAAGPYAEGDPGMGMPAGMDASQEPAAAGEPLPEQLPPQRQNSPV